MKGESDSDRKGKRKGQRMTFEQAMHDTCRELGYDGHLKTIKYAIIIALPKIQYISN